MLGIGAGSQSGQPYGYSTKRRAAGTGLHDYGFRFYSPSLGRWINRDPIEEEGGLNLYAAFANSPTNYGDEYGEVPVWLIPIAVGVGKVLIKRYGPSVVRWGRNRLVKELYKRGWKYKKPTTSGGGRIYECPKTGEQLRIMPKPRHRFRDDPPEKHLSDDYMRYRPGPDQKWSPPYVIPKK